ncbi:MAG TPA: T9SS type A sorting domain-containing protein [bacterium]
MKPTYFKVVLGLVFIALWAAAAFGQGVLTHDTLYVGNVIGVAGQHVMVPIYIRTTDYYQGWTLPMKFGNGLSPLVCDSVSYAGTTMENWAWKSKFVNNGQWDGVQTCGATGLYVWAGDSMLPGYYLALKLYFTIADNAIPQTIAIDTTTCSFAQGGQQNNFIVVVHTQSWRTIVVPGSITVGIIGTEEVNNNSRITNIEILPSIVKRGNAARIRSAGKNIPSSLLRIYDADGRMVDRVRCGELRQSGDDLYYSTDRLPSGVHFIEITDGARTTRAKLIVE